GYRVLIDLILHRSSINNSARLSNKFRGFYFIFKFGISGLLHHVVTTIGDRIRAILTSHLNFDTINDLARNDLGAGLPKFKYHKEHLCPSYEQGKNKRASHPPKPVPNSRQRLHLIHLDLCGPMRIASINGKWITVLLQSPVIIIRTDNDTEFKNQVLKEYFDTVGISHQISSVRTPQQNGVVERRNRTLVEAARTIWVRRQGHMGVYGRGKGSDSVRLGVRE
nr:hypothetical protein [Tanacetum cinerariifolium]